MQHWDWHVDVKSSVYGLLLNVLIVTFLRYCLVYRSVSASIYVNISRYVNLFLLELTKNIPLRRND